MRFPKSPDEYSAFTSRWGKNLNRLYFAGACICLGYVLYRGRLLRRMKESGELETTAWDHMSTATKYISISSFGMNRHGQVNEDDPVKVIHIDGLRSIDSFEVKRGELNYKSPKELSKERKQKKKELDEELDDTDKFDR